LADQKTAAPSSGVRRGLSNGLKKSKPEVDRFRTLCMDPSMLPDMCSSIGVASYGALGHVPPRLPASYFGDHSLTDSDESWQTIAALS